MRYGPKEVIREKQIRVKLENKKYGKKRGLDW